MLQKRVDLFSKRSGDYGIVPAPCRRRDATALCLQSRAQIAPQFSGIDPVEKFISSRLEQTKPI